MQKGGSVASDAVTSLVSDDTYLHMNKTFTNTLSQCGGSSCPTCGSKLGGKKHKTKKGKKVKKGGDSPFKSEPAPALDSVLPRQMNMSEVTQEFKVVEGGKKKSVVKKKKGGNLKSLHELNSNSSDYKLKNKSGGSDNTSLNYNAARSTIFTYGDIIDRGNQQVQNKLLATESVPTMPTLNKGTEFGKTLDSDMKFSYSGDKITGGSPKSALKKLVKKVRSYLPSLTKSKSAKTSKTTKSSKTKSSKKSKSPKTKRV